jgi:protein-disulfide isomerase
MRGIPRSRLTLYAAVGLVAAGGAAALIVLSVSGGSSKKTTTAAATTAAVTGTHTTSATEASAGPSLTGVAETRKLFAGIPQQGIVLGKASAPVTLIEFADLQCPFCAEYATNGLPGIVRDYVRPGKVKLVFEGIAFIGPDSEVALRAAYSAALQGHLWEMIDLLYRNQGAENSGWVTGPLLKAIGQGITGLDVNAMLVARNTPAVDQAITTAQGQASNAHVNSTPTFFAGKTGQTVQHISVSTLDTAAFRPTLDALLK